MSINSECNEIISSLNQLLENDSDLNKRELGNLSSSIKYLRNGDLYDLLIKKNETGVLQKFDKLLEKVNEKTFQDVLSKNAQNCIFLERTSLDKLSIGDKVYNTQICSITKNYNEQKGMYVCYDKLGFPFLVIKATIQDKSTLYSNKWIKKDEILRYFLETDKQIYNVKTFNKGPNKLILDTMSKGLNLDVHCFVRTISNSDIPYIYKGVFHIDKLNLENDYWINIKNGKDSNSLSEKTIKEMIMDEDDVFFNHLVSETELNQRINDNKRPAKKSKNRNCRMVYERDPKVTKEALIRSDYHCECCDKANEEYFLCQATGENYVEGHHLIPICFQNDFIYDLDVTGNVISMCPDCHAKIHHAKLEQRFELLFKLYKMRIEQLDKFGIMLSFEQLKKYYM